MLHQHPQTPKPQNPRNSKEKFLFETIIKYTRPTRSLQALVNSIDEL